MLGIFLKLHYTGDFQPHFVYSYYNSNKNHPIQLTENESNRIFMIIYIIWCANIHVVFI